MTFFWVELSSKNIISIDNTRKLNIAIGRKGKNMVLIFWNYIIRVNKIESCFFIYITKNFRIYLIYFKKIPAHMRNFKFFFQPFKSYYASLYQAQSFPIPSSLESNRSCIPKHIPRILFSFILENSRIDLTKFWS